MITEDPNITHLKEATVLPCLPFLGKTALPALVCLHPVFADPCFTPMYSFGCASVCLPSIKAAMVVFFVKSVYENFFRFQHWGPYRALSFPSLLDMAHEQAQPTLAVVMMH